MITTTDHNKPCDKARSARHFIKMIHGWVGVFASLFIFLVAATGVGLAFFGEMVELQYGDIVHAPTAPDADIGDIVAAAETGHPQLQVMGMFMPDTRVEGLETALIYGMSESAKGEFIMISVDPGSATYKGEFLVSDMFAHEFNDFHSSLLLGEWGLTFIAIIGILMLLFVLTGLYMWWPHGSSKIHRKLFKIQTSGKLVGKMFNWHGLAGIWLGVFTLLFAITGIGLSRPAWLGPATSQVDKPPQWTARLKQNCGHPVSISDAAQQALHAFPGHRVTGLHIIRGEENKYVFSLRDQGDWNTRFGDAYAEVHTQCANEIWSTTLVQQPPSTVFGTMMLSLHGGHVFGALRAIITIITGLALMLLSGSGVYVFFKRTLPTQVSRKAKQQSSSVMTTDPYTKQME